MQALTVMRPYRLLALIGAGALGACHYNTMAIQKEYSASYQACNAEAEGNAEHFQHCMESNRWVMGTEKLEKPEKAATAASLHNSGVGIGVGPGYALERPGAAPAENTSGGGED